MKCESKDMVLYAVTDRTWLNGETLGKQVEDAIKGGVTFVQLREKHLDREEIKKQALEIKGICKRYNVPFVINDDVELAIEVGADGVHVGQEDMQAGLARKKLGEDYILGVSAHTVEEALNAQSNGADYLGVGAVFNTTSKNNVTRMSNETLSAICEAVTIPVVAIGGISSDNVTELAGTGIDGVAVISAIFAKENKTEAARKLRQKVEKYISNI